MPVTIVGRALCTVVASGVMSPRFDATSASVGWSEMLSGSRLSGSDHFPPQGRSWHFCCSVLYFAMPCKVMVGDFEKIYYFLNPTHDGSKFFQAVSINVKR